MQAVPPLSEFAANLVQTGQGYWTTEAESTVSYPSDGNECYASIEENSFWFNHRNHAITSLVSSYAPCGPIFDVGGGNGFVSLAIEQAGFDAVLVEPGRQGATVAMKRGLQSVVCSTLEDVGFKERSLPAVGLFDVLEHIEDDVSFLRTLHSLLAKKGRLYLTVPAYNFLWSFDDDDAGHYRRYTVRTLRKQLASAGFEIEYASYLFSFLPPAILAVRSVPSIVGLRRSISHDVARQDHSQRKGWTGKLIQRILGHELSRIQRKQKVPFGSSCIVVARRLEMTHGTEEMQFSKAA